MHRSLLLTIALLGGLAISGGPVLTAMTADPAVAAETSSKKKKKVKTNFNKPTPRKKNYCGYPEPPNPAGMSDYCSYMYNIYCRRGVGCSKYGRDFMSWDD